MKVVVYFNKRHFSGDENLTSRDSEENGWKRSRNILDYRLCLKINWKLELRNWVVNAIGHGVK